MSRKILLVDDSATVLMMERMILATERAEILTATNGVDAQAKAKLEHPDLILMDVVMPQMNGLEACKALKDDPETRNIPIILVTTRGEAQSVEQGFASGCNDYLTKPIDSIDLLNKVRNYLGNAP